MKDGGDVLCIGLVKKNTLDFLVPRIKNCAINKKMTSFRFLPSYCQTIFIAAFILKLMKIRIISTFCAEYVLVAMTNTIAAMTASYMHHSGILSGILISYRMVRMSC